jgi:hypothetical protein
MSQVRIGLVTRGDDAGSCRGADLAVMEAAEKGILRNASLMVPGPTFRHAADLLRGRRDICVGLHATLNAEWDAPKWAPVLPAREVPTLVDSRGFFLQNPRLMHERGASPDEMMAETKAQLDLARSAGLEIAYLDEHMVFGWIDGMQQRLSEFCRREGLIESRSAVKGLPPVEGEFADSPSRLIARLDAAAPGTYLIVNHPGYDDEEMRELAHPGVPAGRVARERDADRRMWSDPRVLDYCRTRGVMPIRYTEIPPPAPG